MTECSSTGCSKPARCAIRTDRPSRGGLRTTIFYDDRVAPKAAAPYCKACALALVPALVSIVDNDDR